ncbi:unnamed protein product [Candidula unifasciata]|uniref:Uncharacterized protein n=1 Tax=Candidula unifasciata TaxID=100452 RepID=A0A8S3ZLP8_9EUPU|nr:unnamed protein product [Candidula unifasciata]
MPSEARTSMAEVVITQEDVLAMSLMVHLCVFLELLANRLVGWLSPMLSERSSIVRTLTSLHRMKPGLLAKVLMEQTTLWSIILLIMVSLTYTSLSLTPFSHQPQPYPKFLVRVILTSSIARFSVMATRIVLVRDPVIGQIKTTATPGQSGHAILDFFYCAYSAATNFLYLCYHENLLLGVTSSFMEVSSTPVECCRLIEQSNKALGSQSYRKTTILTCALCFICRVMLPLLFLILALRQESPFCMDEVPLVNFFISGAFYATFNGLFLSQSIRRLRYSSQHPIPQTCIQSSSAQVPFSIHMTSNETLQGQVNDNHGQSRLSDFNYTLIETCNDKGLLRDLASDNIQKSYLVQMDDSKQSVAKKSAKSSSGDILGRFHFNSYTGRTTVKSRSYDCLLGSQDLVCEEETMMFVGGLNNQTGNNDQSDLDHTVVFVEQTGSFES